MLPPAVHAAADAFGHQTAARNRRIATDYPLLQFGYALAGSHKHVAHGVFVIRMHAHGDRGAVFQQIERLKNQGLQDAFMLFFQHPARTGRNGLLRQQGNVFAPDIAYAAALGVQ